MSRTFRRLNAEYILQGGGTHYRSKIAGYYTECDWDPIARLFIDRLPTKEELFRRFRNLHCDGHRLYRFEGMKKWQRRDQNKIDRAKHRNKITRFLKGTDDDVVVEKRGRYPHWYW